jgi:hypothetical protein
MTAWEYLFLRIEGHNGSLASTNNMLVHQSDGKYAGTRMRNDAATMTGLVNDLGSEVWEMVSSEGSVYEWTHFAVVFKRPQA